MGGGGGGGGGGDGSGSDGGNGGHAGGGNDGGGRVKVLGAVSIPFLHELCATFDVADSPSTSLFSPSPSSPKRATKATKLMPIHTALLIRATPRGHWAQQQSCSRRLASAAPTTLLRPRFEDLRIGG